MPANFEQLEAEAIRRREAEAGRPWLRVGTALCGQAAGADAVVAALRDALESQGVEARISEVGCIGLCYAEPLLDVQLPGGPRVFYGNFDPGRAGEVVSAHVAGGQPVEELALGYLAPEDAGDDFVPPPGLRGTWACILCALGRTVSRCATRATSTRWTFTSTSRPAVIAP